MSLALVALAGPAGCAPGAGAPSAGDPDAEVAAWNQLVAQLDAGRTVFPAAIGDTAVADGDRLFWLDESGDPPVLARFDDTTATTLRYGFSVGDADHSNFRVSASLVVTADPLSSPVVYRAYDAGAADSPRGMTTLPDPPRAGTRFAAYAVDGDTVYFIDDSTPGSTALLRWAPGTGAAPAAVTTLESAGATVGELQDFIVSGTVAAVIESGHLWKLDIAANRATWLMNTTEADGAFDLRSDGVMFTSGARLLFFDFGKDALTDVSALIDANGYQPTPAFPDGARYLQDFARWKTSVVYVGQSGLFAYDLAADRVTPLLLSPMRDDLRIDYRNPVVLDDGKAFVTGLTSSDGALGADGPTYAIDLDTRLR
jgi:hypothetical protein